MNRFLMALMVLVSTLSIARAGDTYKIDAEHSFVTFRIQHMGVSYSFGRFNQPTGSFVIDKEDPTKGSFDLTIDAAKIDTGNAKRDAHLKSEDFFNATEFPTITFKSKSIAKVDDKVIAVTGDLTLHGVTNSITVKLEFVGEGKNPMNRDSIAGYETQVIKLKRSDFGMKNMLGPVGDEVTLVIGLEGVKQ